LHPVPLNGTGFSLKVTTTEEVFGTAAGGDGGCVVGDVELD